MKFTKMHGLSNDYIYINALEETVTNPSELAIAMSKPHTGIGADGIVLIEPCQQADFAMRIFNADGSEAEMCGNAARCIGKYVYERGLTDKKEVSLRTKGGMKVLHLTVEGEKVVSVRVDMGAPVFDPTLIPVSIPGTDVTNYPIEAGDNTYRVTCLSMGNPHCVIFVDDVEAIPLAEVGPLIECHPYFPERINVEFAEIVDRQHLKMRVWERGSGETMACGTGACAALVAAAIQGFSARQATLSLRGGDMLVEWMAADNHVYQQGPAAFVFDGQWLGEE